MSNVPTLNNGNLWSESLANSSINPYISTSEGDTAPGSIEPVLDTQLSSQPGNIKSNFYGWYDRLKLTPTTGLLLSYQAYTVIDPNGNLVSKSSGTASVSDNTTTFVYINEAGNVTTGTPLPNVCILLALVVSASGAITQFTDARKQKIAQITPYRLPTVATPWQIGDIKESARPAPEPGWLPCDGRSLSTTTYATLFAAIGYVHGGSGTSFNIPDRRGRVGLGAGNGYSRGGKGGSATQRLLVSQIPLHKHGVIDPGHTHGVIDGGHSHVVNDPGHNHPVYEQPHKHNTLKNRAVIPDVDDQGGQAGAELSSAASMSGNPFWFTDAATTGLSLGNADTRVSVRQSASNVSNAAATTGIQTANEGGNGEFSIMPPYEVCNYFIKVE